MTARVSPDSTVITRWVRSLPLAFLVVGFGFGTWLSRLPAVRDELGASAAEMSVYGLSLASGSIIGLVMSGSIVQRLGPRRTLFHCAIIAAVALPSTATLILAGAIPIGLVMLFVYGVAFSIADVAVNVSGANAEAAFGKARLPLMHAGYSFGAVAATGIGALAETWGISVPLHFTVVMLAGAGALLSLLRYLPRDEQAVRAGETQATRAGETQATAPGSLARSYSPWRDPRMLLIGLIALTFGLFEGTAADWLPLALVDGRGLSNQLGSVMLSVLFASIMAVRIVGSWLIERFGRVAVLRSSALLAAVGAVTTILVPGHTGAVIGVVAWGAGTGLGWPIAISAAADRADTAARAVGAVSAIGYGAMLVGPLAFGFLGERIGLLPAFWALLPFAVYAAIFASRVRAAATHRGA